MAKSEASQPVSKLYWAFVALFALLAAAIFYMRPPLLHSLRALAFDAYQRLSPASPPPDSPIRVVQIDDASLARLGQWPWPRSTLAALTQKLGDDGAAAIAFDVLFAEPDRTSPEQLLASVPAQQRAAVRRALGSPPTHDSIFATALERYPSVLSASLQNETPNTVFPAKAGFVVAGDDPAPLLPTFSGVSTNLPQLTDVAHGVGFMNWLPDNDQIVRRVPLLARQAGATAPSLAMEALRVALGASSYIERGANASGATAFGRNTGMNGLRVGPAAIPTDSDGQMWIYFRRYDPREDISAWRVINNEIAPDTFRGAIVFIGASAPGLLDLRATPLDASVPGVEIHRQLLEQIVSGHFLNRPDFAPGAELLTSLIIILLLALAAPRIPATFNAALGLGATLLVLGAGLLLFVKAGYLFDPVFPAACAFLFSVSSTTYLYRRTEHQRTEIRRAFGQYVSPRVVHELVAHPERLKLGGEVRELTVFVCDVRNFTSISERLNAEELTSFINSLLTPLTDLIIENNGTIDKYMGDAIMAFWNAPIDDANHALHACQTSLLIAERMHTLNKNWRDEAEAAGRPFNDVTIGIGLNTGECCVGNLGSERRFDYSAIGDSVNIASRLEGLTKQHKLTLLVGEDTARQAPDLPFIEVDLVRLKGRQTPTHVFTLLPEADTPSWRAAAETHNAFLAAYRQAQCDEAERLLSDVSQRAPTALRPLYANYATRLEQLKTNRPDAWDGVFDLEQK